MNPDNSKTYDPHRLLLNLSDKMNLKRSVALSNLSIYYISSNMEWRICITRWTIFCIRYSRLF